MFSVRSTRSTRNFALALILLTFMGCASTSGDGPYFGKVNPPEGQVLRYVSGSEPKTLDPHKITGRSEARIAAALFDGLVEYEEATMGQRPSLAKSWKQSSDGTVWTFYLREYARWSDNAPLTAHDFKYSWQRAVSPKILAPLADSMYVVKNAKPYREEKAFVHDQQTGKFATIGDLERAKGQQAVTFTGNEPERFDKTPPVQTLLETDEQNGQPVNASATMASTTNIENYLFVEGNEKARVKELEKDAELARFVAGKDFVPVQKEHVGVRALDDYTFQVTLEGPTAYFLKMLYLQVFRPVPRQAIEKYGDDLWAKRENIITSGAFKLEEWRPYEQIVVVRNLVFWDNANTRLDKIIFPTVEKQTTAMNMYKVGEIDAISSDKFHAPWGIYFKETGKKDYTNRPLFQIEALGINTTVPTLRDVRVRKALSMAIDRQVIADSVPGRIPTTSFVPQMEGYENAKVEDYNPAKARQLLAEANFPGGTGFPDLEILSNREAPSETLELIQEMWRSQLGIKIRLTRKDYLTYNQDVSARNLNFNGFARWAWVGGYVDPYTFLELVRSDSENNQSAWKNTSYDGMLDAANRQTEPRTRMKLLHDAEEYMMAQQPMIPLYVAQGAFMTKPYVKNLVPNLLDQHDWRQIYIDHNMTVENRFFEPFEFWPRTHFAFLIP